MSSTEPVMRYFFMLFSKVLAASSRTSLPGSVTPLSCLAPEFRSLRQGWNGDTDDGESHPLAGTDYPRADGLLTTTSGHHTLNMLAAVAVLAHVKSWRAPKSSES